MGACVRRGHPLITSLWGVPEDYYTVNVCFSLCRTSLCVCVCVGRVSSSTVGACKSGADEK